jgi:hypothetical protein
MWGPAATGGLAGKRMDSAKKVSLVKKMRSLSVQNAGEKKREIPW